MKELFDSVSSDCSKIVTNSYSTSFSLATRMLSSSIRTHIYNIYGFVRFADEIVDTFHSYNKMELFNRFEESLYLAISNKISLNPILNSFQMTVNLYHIDIDMVLDKFQPHIIIDIFNPRLRLEKSLHKSYPPLTQKKGGLLPPFVYSNCLAYSLYQLSSVSSKS